VVNRSRTTRELARRRFQNIGASSIFSKSGELRKNVVRVKVKREWSAEREGTNSKIKARLKDGTNRVIKMPNELMEKEAIREEATRKNGVVNVTAPSRNII
jgi:HSP20 family molecular chaperone IbpA